MGRDPGRTGHTVTFTRLGTCYPELVEAFRLAPEIQRGCAASKLPTKKGRPTEGRTIIPFYYGNSNSVRGPGRK